MSYCCVQSNLCLGSDVYMDHVNRSISVDMMVSSLSPRGIASFETDICAA